MKANFPYFKRRHLLKPWLIVGILLFLLWNTNSAQPIENLAPNLEWKPLMEVAHLGYNKADSARHSFRFYPLTEKGLPLNLEQSHQYAFLWDFGQGRLSLEAFPVMIFDHDVPDSVTLRVTALKQVGGPIRHLLKSRESNCDGSKTIKERVNLRRGRVKRDPIQPSIRLFDPGFLPVPGRCINYLMEVTLPADCAMGTTITVDGFAPGENPGVSNQLRVTNVIASSELHWVMTGDASLKFQAEPARDATYYVLLECQVGAEATIKNRLRWLINGVFDPQSPGVECQRRTVAKDSTFDLVGSLDPSYLFCLNNRAVYSGDTAYWHLEMSNDGTGPEEMITVRYEVPKGASFPSQHATRCLWNGQLIDFDEIYRPASNIVYWYINPKDLPPLQACEKADLFFYTLVTEHWDCGKRHCRHPKSEPQKLLQNSVAVSFSQDPSIYPGGMAKVTNQELRLLCENEKLRKIKEGNRRRFWLLNAGAATAGAATATVVLERLKHARVKGKAKMDDLDQQ